MCLRQVQVIQSRSCWDNATGVQWEQLREVAATGICYIYAVLDLHDSQNLEDWTVENLYVTT